MKTKQPLTARNTSHSFKLNSRLCRTFRPALSPFESLPNVGFRLALHIFRPSLYDHFLAFWSRLSCHLELLWLVLGPIKIGEEDKCSRIMSTLLTRHCLSPGMTLTMPHFPNFRKNSGHSIP
jgi:hypothetical protein